MTTRPAVLAPDLTSHRLSSGLTITASALGTVPMVQVHLAIPLDLGTASDLAAFDVLAACWPDSPACADFEQHGGIVAINRRREWLMLSLICDSARAAMIGDTLLALAQRHYSDDQVEAAKAKARQQAALAAAQPGVYSARRLWEAMYGWLPPVVDPAPAPDAVQAVTADQVRAAHRTGIQPAGAHLVVVGDVQVDDVIHGIDRALADWHTGTGLRPSRPAPQRLPTRQVVHHRRAAWQQTHIRLAAPTLPHTDLDGYAATLVASLLLGGNFSSRINTVLREEHGLAYRTTGILTDVLGQDVFVVEADVNPASTEAAMRHLLRILDDFAATGPTGPELDAAIGYTSGNYALSLSSQGGRASCLMSYLINGIDLSGIVEVPRQIASTTAAAVQRAAGRLAPPQLSGVICGDTDHLPPSWL